MKLDKINCILIDDGLLNLKDLEIKLMNNMLGTSMSSELRSE